MKLPHDGISLRFLTASIGVLEKIHGPKMCGPAEAYESFLKALAEAQHNFRKMGNAPPRPKKRSR